MDPEVRERGGFKLVQGSRRRSWEDENSLVLALEARGVDPWEKKLKSVAAIERELEKGDPLIAMYERVGYNKPSLVPVDDRRKALSNEEA